MKIFLLTQDENNGYDTYDSCVVCAENEKDAKTIDPSGTDEPFNPLELSPYSPWARSFESIEVKEIGIANENQKRGVICASFNAG